MQLQCKTKHNIGVFLTFFGKYPLGFFQIPHSANSRVPRTCGSTWLPPTSSRGGRLTRTTGDNQSLLQVQLIVKLAQLRTTIIFYFFYLYLTDCETSTTGDNQSMLQVQLIVTLPQLRATRTCVQIHEIVNQSQLWTMTACFRSIQSVQM